MIKHIVFWKVVDEYEGMSHEDILSKMKVMLEALPAKIDVIKELEVGKNYNGSSAAFDLSLYSAFDSEEDLTTYANHPEHLKVVEFFGKVVEERAVVDYVV